MFRKTKEIGERYLENIKDNMFIFFPTISPKWVEALFIFLIFLSIFGAVRACASLEDKLDRFIESNKAPRVAEQIIEAPVIIPEQVTLRSFISYSPETLTSLSWSLVDGGYGIDISHSVYNLNLIKKYINLVGLDQLEPKYTIGVSNLLSDQRSLSFSLDVFLYRIQGGKIFSRVAGFSEISNLNLESPLSELRGHFAIYYTRTFKKKIFPQDIASLYVGVVSNTTQITDFTKGLLSVKDLKPTKENLSFGLYYSPNSFKRNSASFDFSIEAMKLSLNRRF